MELIEDIEKAIGKIGAQERKEEERERRRQEAGARAEGWALLLLLLTNLGSFVHHIGEALGLVADESTAAAKYRRDTTSAARLHSQRLREMLQRAMKYRPGVTKTVNSHLKSAKKIEGPACGASNMFDGAVGVAGKWRQAEAATIDAEVKGENEKKTENRGDGERGAKERKGAELTLTKSLSRLELNLLHGKSTSEMVCRGSKASQTSAKSFRDSVKDELGEITSQEKKVVDLQKKLGVDDGGWKLIWKGEGNGLDRNEVREMEEKMLGIAREFVDGLEKTYFEPKVKDRE